MTRRRQLQLPGLQRPPAKPPVRAKLDLSARAFQRALYRHGFRRAGPLTFQFIDPATEQVIQVAAVCRVNPTRIARRATLAKLLRLRSRGQQ